jgi:hypothetical protein
MRTYVFKGEVMRKMSNMALAVATLPVSARGKAECVAAK